MLISESIIITELLVHPLEFCRDDKVLHVDKVSNWILEAGLNDPLQIKGLLAATFHQTIVGINYSSTYPAPGSPITVSDAVAISAGIVKAIEPRTPPDVFLIDILNQNLGFSRETIPALVSRVMQIYRYSSGLDIEATERFVTAVARKYNFTQQQMFNGIMTAGILNHTSSEQNPTYGITKREAMLLSRKMVSFRSATPREALIFIFNYLKIRSPKKYGSLLITEFFNDPLANPNSELNLEDLIAISNLLNLEGNNRLDELYWKINKK